MKKQILSSLALIASVAATLNVSADGIDSVSGGIFELDPILPDLSESGSLESDDITFLMFEGTSMIGPGGLEVFTDVGSSTTTFLAEGTLVNSYIFHFDPRDNGGSVVEFSGGSATFENNILGLVASGSGLDATDYLGNAGTIYDTGVAQRNAGFGNEWDSFDSDFDYYSFSGDTFTIDSLTVKNTRIDQIRVLTAVPEPSTIAGIGIGVLALGFLTYKRRKNATVEA
ncbi:PEP-CTERM sorting domain-containing protein [Puniceicoccaceae bacterium K14]|nr:PEP-CTERM sorting domain-containing protein [Puniceicoccaceae bacterium K14]